MSAAHAAQLRRGIRLEVFTVAWMVVEAVVSIGAGVVAGSLLLVAFGLDGAIELASGGILLWRLCVEAEGGDGERVDRAERRAGWAVAVALGLLCLYVLATAVSGLATAAKPEGAPLGIAVAAAAAVVMPWLAVGKRRLAARLDSGALRGDAAGSLTCGYMAAAVLVGLALNARFGWWGAEDAAAFAFLSWLLQETREALAEAGGHKAGGG